MKQDRMSSWSCALKDDLATSTWWTMRRESHGMTDCGQGNLGEPRKRILDTVSPRRHVVVGLELHTGSTNIALSNGNTTEIRTHLRGAVKA